MLAEAALLWWGSRDGLCLCLYVKVHCLCKAYLPSHLGLGVVHPISRVLWEWTRRKRKHKTALESHMTCHALPRSVETALKKGSSSEQTSVGPL